MEPSSPRKDKYRDVKALYKLIPSYQDVLTFSEGDEFQILSQTTEYEGWALAKINNKIGFVPIDYVGPCARSKPNCQQQQQASENNKLATDGDQTANLEPTETTRLLTGDEEQTFG